LDPFPHGCPVGLRATPSEMGELVVSLAARMRDLWDASVFVINPSKGQSYPVMFLGVTGKARRPIALFPAWEDDGRKRRVTYGRQMSLLARIASAGVSGESLDSFAPHHAGIGRIGPPLLVPLASSIQEAAGLYRDLFDHLGAAARMTITAIPVASGRPEIPVARCYAREETVRPRMVWFPGWAATGDRDLIDVRRMELLLQKSEQRDLAEIPAEVAFSSP
ncbi:MAG: hypothetical protein ABMA64_15480, partial [Myxococcota bacterium]